MDENGLQAGESEEENLRAMEKDIDEFLSSIRENVSKNTDLQNEGMSSEFYYDSVSSDDCFENEPLPTRSCDPSNQGHVKKLRYRPCKNKHGVIKGNMKDYEKHKLQSSYIDAEWHRHRGRRFGHTSGYENRHHKSFPSGWRDEYYSHKTLSPRNDEFHQERSLSPIGSYDQGQSFSLSGRSEHQRARSFTPTRKGDRPQPKCFVPKRRHEYRWRNFYPEEMDESSQGSYVCKERNFCEKTITSMSGSSDDDSISHRVYSRGSNSPINWSESYDYDSDFEDEDSSQPWRPEENHPNMEEGNGQNVMSIIRSCLQRAIAYDPEIATKVTEACMALLNTPANEPAESDYECDRDSWAAYEEELGRVSPQSWQDHRSPSFTESLGASSSRSGFSRHSDRFHGHSKGSVLEHCRSRGDKQDGRDKYNHLGRHKKARYSPDYKKKDDRRPSTAASQTQRARKRSFSEHSKNHHEEEFNLKGAVSWSIRKIRKQCEGESSSTVRRALLLLLEVHERECKVYMKKPEAHPDYKKEYREFVELKAKSIADLGGDPNSYDFEQDWKKYWPVQMYKLFQENWNTKMHSCTSLLLKKCDSGSKLPHSSSIKSTVKQPCKNKGKKNKDGGEGEAVNMEESIKEVKTSKTKGELLVVTHSSLEDQQSTEANSTVFCKNQEEINKEIFSILKLLNHIKHKFNDCEASFDKLYEKVMSLKEDSVAINDILQDDLPLLEKIDENLKETLEDVNLTLIQKAVIQETHERFKSFLRNSKENNSHSVKCKEVRIMEKLIEDMHSSMDSTTREHQIPCLLTNSHSCVASSEGSKKVPPHTSCSCCGTNQPVSQPRRTLTEVSLVGSSGPENRARCPPGDASGASFVLCKSQDGVQCNRNYTSDVISVEKQASRPRTLTEICLVGLSCPASSIAHTHSVVFAGQDSSMRQPPPPGVTPPPPGVTPPPAVIPSPPDVTPLPPSVTPPPDVTPPPSGVTPPPPGITPPPPGDTLPPLGVTPQISDLTQSWGPISPSLSIKPSFPGTTPSHSVTMPPYSVSTPLDSAIISPHSVTTVPHCVKPSSSVTPRPSSSTSDVALSSRVTPAPSGLSLSSVNNGLHSSVLTLSQTPLVGSSSLPTASGPADQLSNDKTTRASHHMSTIFTSSKDNFKLPQNKVTGMISITDKPPQPSQELLRSTIKDCFVSSSLDEESCDIISTKEGLLTIDTSAEGSSGALVPNLPEDILRMFEVKADDKIEGNSDDKAGVKMGSVKNSSIKSTAKKPIKITIPQFSLQKSMPRFNPITDDQELL